MSYDLDQFVSDCRAILARDGGPKGREQVRLKLEQLLANRDFVETYCGEQVPRGLKVLYEDPDLGFQVLAHINDKARVSPPHDHGASWAIYGQATHYTDMIEWEREDDGANPAQAKLKPVKKYRLLPGHAVYASTRTKVYRRSCSPLCLTLSPSEERGLVEFAGPRSVMALSKAWPSSSASAALIRPSSVAPELPRPSKRGTTATSLSNLACPRSCVSP